MLKNILYPLLKISHIREPLSNLSVLTLLRIPGVYVPTVFDNYNKEVTVGDEKVLSDIGSVQVPPIDLLSDSP